MRVQYHFDVNLAVGQSWATVTIPVPAGKRLIIDQISGDVRIGPSERAVVQVNTGPITSFPDSSSVNFTRHYFPLTAAGTNISVGPHAQSYFFNAQPEIFSDIDVVVLLSRGPTPSAFSGAAVAIIGLSGRMVDQPSP